MDSKFHFSSQPASFKNDYPNPDFYSSALDTDAHSN